MRTGRFGTSLLESKRPVHAPQVGNERLRAAIAASGLTIAAVAGHAGVDSKTAERWLSTGRTPHRRHRWATAGLLGVDETYLWPSVLDEIRFRSASESELVTLYPNRGAVPRDLWATLVEQAVEGIDILVYAGLFLLDGYPELPTLLGEKGRAGTSVRLLLGDPQAEVVHKRGVEEGIGDGLAARVRISLNYLRPIMAIPGVELRLHMTTLYNSIYRFDKDMLVNCHAYGAPAAQSLVLHFRRLPGGRLFNHYQSSLDRVWEQTTPLTTENP